jgi:hypothetical protein
MENAVLLWNTISMTDKIILSVYVFIFLLAFGVVVWSTRKLVRQYIALRAFNKWLKAYEAVADEETMNRYKWKAAQHLEEMDYDDLKNEISAAIKSQQKQ